MKPIPSLEKIVGEYKSLQLSKKHLKTLEVNIDRELDRLEELKIILDKEHQDVLDLEPKTIRGLFQNILGRNEEQYEIEKQEYLMAALQFNEVKKVIDLLNFEKDILIGKLDKEEEVKSNFRKLIFKRNTLIAKEYPYLAQQLQSINEQLDSGFSFLRELTEAFIIAREIEKVVTEMVKYLEEARSLDNWGNDWIIINQVNYTRNLIIDKAVDLSCKAKKLLQELEEQLEDIYKYRSIKRISKFEEFQHFNDIYYDRLISDWIVKKKISSSINFLVGTNDSVERVISTLKNQINLTDRNLKYLKSRQKEVILESIK